MEPPGAPLLPGSTWFLSQADGLYYITDTMGGVEVRNAAGVTRSHETPCLDGCRTKITYAVDGQQPSIVLIRPNQTGAPETIFPRPGAEAGFENEPNRSGFTPVVPVVSFALIVAAIIDGLEQQANNLDRCFTACSRLVPALYQLKEGMVGMVGIYANLSNRLDTAISICTGFAPQEAAVWLATCRSNLDDALAEIGRRVGVANAAYSTWQAWDCNNSIYLGGQEAEGPTSTGLNDLKRVASLYNEATLNLQSWVSAVECAEYLAQNLPQPNVATDWIEVAVSNIVVEGGSVASFDITPLQNYSGPRPNVIKNSVGTEFLMSVDWPDPVDLAANEGTITAYGSPPNAQALEGQAWIHYRP